MSEKSNIVNIFRKFFEEKENGEITAETAKEFLNSLNWLCKKMFFNGNNNDDCKDITSKVFEGILKYGENTWRLTRIENNTNNARIFAYVKRTMINTISNIKDEYYSEKNNIRTKIKKALNSLVEEGFLNFDKGKYSLNNGKEKKKDCSVGEIYEYYSIYKNDQIKFEKVISLIKKIFTEYLENCAVSDSLLKEIFLKFVIGKKVTYLQIVDEKDYDNQESREIVINDKNSSFDENIEIKEMIMKWINKAKIVLGNDFTIFAKLFLLRYYGNYTLSEISEMFSISKSSVDNYSKRFIESMNIDDDIEANEFSDYQNVLYEILSNLLKIDLTEE